MRQQGTRRVISQLGPGLRRLVAARRSGRHSPTSRGHRPGRRPGRARPSAPSCAPPPLQGFGGCKPAAVMKLPRRWRGQRSPSVLGADGAFEARSPCRRRAGREEVHTYAGRDAIAVRDPSLPGPAPPPARPGSRISRATLVRRAARAPRGRLAHHDPRAGPGGRGRGSAPPCW